jgi:TRAP-type C4-dicarboxylate transport system substrate-binding protein
MEKKAGIMLGTVIWLIFAFCLNIPCQAAATKVIEWKFQDTYPIAAWPAAHLNVPMIEWIQKVTKGKLKITRYEPGALASVNDTYDALSRGVFDAAALYPGFYTGVMPEGNVEQGLPWGWIDAKAQAVSLFKFGMFDLMKKVYDKHNIHLLAHYTMGDVYNIGTAKPVTKLDDLKGMKIRAVGIYGDYVKALGATPVSIPYGEIYMAIKMGTIDGYLASAGALISNKLGEVVKNYLLPTTNSIGFVVGINKKSWDALPEDIKNLLDTSAPQVAVGIAALYSGVVENSMKASVKDYGVKFQMLSVEDQMKATKISQPIWDEAAAKSTESKQAVEAIRQTLIYLGRMPD